MVIDEERRDWKIIAEKTLTMGGLSPPANPLFSPALLHWKNQHYLARVYDISLLVAPEEKDAYTGFYLYCGKTDKPIPNYWPEQIKRQGNILSLDVPYKIDLNQRGQILEKHDSILGPITRKLPSGIEAKLVGFSL